MKIYTTTINILKMWLRKHQGKVVREFIETGSEITGNIGGAIIGGSLAGPPGMIIGGASGPIIVKILKKIGTELKSRYLGNREEIRIGAVFTFALNKFTINESKGCILRNDNFFDTNVKNRSNADEILEGVILIAQKAYEEKKLIYLGNLFANICFDSGIDIEQANYLLKISESLSFRQYCLMEIFRSKELYTQLIHSEIDVKKQENIKICRNDIVVEIKDLQSKGLLRLPWRIRDIEDYSRPISLIDIEMTENGTKLCEILSLDEIEKEVLDKIKEQMDISDK